MPDDNTDDGPEMDANAPSESIVYEIGEDDRPSGIVVRAVATLTDTAILDLDPLYNTIDPENIDKLAGSQNKRPIEDCAVSFRYNGCLVTVNQRSVQVRTEPDDESE